MRRAVLYAIAAGILWGLTYPLSEVALTLGNFLVVTFLIYLILSIIGLVDVCRRQLTLDVQALLYGSVLALLNILSMATFYVGINHINAALIAFISQLYPILTMVIEGYSSRSALIAVPLYVAGLMLLFNATMYNAIGILSGVALALIYTVYVLIYNRYCVKLGYEVINTATYIQTTIVSGLLSIFVGVHIKNIAYLTLSCVALSAIVYICYMLEGMSHEELNPTIVAFALSLEPVSATFVESLAYDLRITMLEMLGMILIISSVSIMCMSRRPINEYKATLAVEYRFEESIERVGKAYSKMLSMFYKLSDEITGIFISLLSRENYVLVGPPGTGKTTLIYTLSKLLNAKWFYRQLTKFTDLEEILGPIDIAELLKGRVVRIYYNSIVESDLALLDEIFNASSAILNTLLSILNERVIYDGDKVIPVKTWTVYASSNRVPDEEELQALYDRFPLRSFLSYVTPEETENLIIKGWQLRMELDKLEPVASMEDVRTCHNYLINYVYENLSNIAKHIAPIIASFVEHVQISNRTRVKVALYVTSLSALELGELKLDPSTIRMATLRILKYLVLSRDQLNEYYAFVKAHMPDELVRLYELISEARALINNLLFDKARERIEEAYELLKIVRERWGNTLTVFFKNELEEIENLMSKIKESIEL